MLPGGPIVSRELVTFLRLKRAFLGLLGYLVLLSVITTMSWFLWSAMGGATVGFILSRQLFTQVSIIQLVVFGIGAAALAHYEITSERRRNTLESLLATPLRPYEIALGKTIASVGYVLLVAVAGVPIYAVFLMFGGVAAREIAVAVYLTLLTGLTYSMIVVGTASSQKGKTYSSGTWMWIFLLLNWGATAFLRLLLEVVFKTPEKSTEAFLTTLSAVLSPIQTYYALISPWSLGGSLKITAGALLACHTALQAILFLAFLKLACRNLKKETTKKVEHPSSRRKEKKALSDKHIFSKRLFPIPDRINPVAAKEIAARIPRKPLALIGYFLILAAGVGIVCWISVLAKSYTNSPEDVRGIFDAVSLGAIVIVCFAALGYGADTLAGEIERDTAPMLVSTTLGSLSIAKGKLWALLSLTLGVFSISYVAFVFFFSLFNPTATLHCLGRIVPMMVGAAASGAMYGSASIALSAGAKTTRSAARRAFLLLLFIYLLFVGCEFLFSAILGPFSPGTGEKISSTILGTVFFPAAFLVSGSPIARWFFFPLGTAASLALALLLLRLGGKIFEKRVVKETERAGSS